MCRGADVSDSPEFDEPFTARMWAIVGSEACDASFEDGIVLIMPSKARAGAELARRQALPTESDDYVDEYHVVLLVHVDAIGWNSLDPVSDDWPMR